jgi:chaperonin cofactor prefoldin
MDPETAGDLRRWTHRVGIYLGTFLAGGLIAFAYSYAPLHDAKNWRIDYLEERLEFKQRQLTDLQAELKQLKSESVDRPDTGTFKRLKGELATTSSTVGDLKKKLARSARQIEELERSRDKWKSRHAEAESQRKTLASKIEAVEQNAASAPVPAAPAPDPGSETRIASNVEVALGERWSSDDGRAQFDLVELEADQAKVVSDPTALAPGTVPTAIGVRAGDQFHIGLSSGRALRVTVQSLNGGDSITVDVTE